MLTTFITLLFAFLAFFVSVCLQCIYRRQTYTEKVPVQEVLEGAIRQLI